MSESVQAVPHLAPPREIHIRRRAALPTVREWMKHSVLFLLTCVTTTFAGIVIASPEPSVPVPGVSGVLGYILFVPDYYLRIVAALLSNAVAHPAILAQGL